MMAPFWPHSGPTLNPAEPRCASLSGTRVPFVSLETSPTGPHPAASLALGGVVVPACCVWPAQVLPRLATRAAEKRPAGGREGAGAGRKLPAATAARSGQATRSKAPPSTTGTAAPAWSPADSRDATVRA